MTNKTSPDALFRLSTSLLVMYSVYRTPYHAMTISIIVNIGVNGILVAVGS